MTTAAAHDPATPRWSTPRASDPLEAWIRAEQGPLWRYLQLLGASPQEAEDLAQEAFLRVLRRGRGPARRAYLRTTARNLFVDHVRSSPGARPEAPDVDRWLAVHPTALDDDRIERLRACLERLAPRARQALIEHHGNGAPLRTLARELSLGIEGVRALLRRARDAVRICLSRGSEP